MVLTREADHEQRDGEAQDVHGQVEPFVWWLETSVESLNTDSRHL